MPLIPSQPFTKTKKGKLRLSDSYKNYLRSVVGMTSEERREWYLLGVHLTNSKEAYLVDILGTYEFLEKSIA